MESHSGEVVGGTVVVSDSVVVKVAVASVTVVIVLTISALAEASVTAVTVLIFSAVMVVVGAAVAVESGKLLSPDPLSREFYGYNLIFGISIV